MLVIAVCLVFSTLFGEVCSFTFPSRLSTLVSKSRRASTEKVSISPGLLFLDALYMPPAQEYDKSIVLQYDHLSRSNLNTFEASKVLLDLQSKKFVATVDEQHRALCKLLFEAYFRLPEMNIPSLIDGLQLFRSLQFRISPDVSLTGLLLIIKRRMMSMSDSQVPGVLTLLADIGVRLELLPKDLIKLLNEKVSSGENRFSLVPATYLLDGFTRLGFNTTNLSKKMFGVLLRLGTRSLQRCVSHDYVSRDNVIKVLSSWADLGFNATHMDVEKHRVTLQAVEAVSSQLFVKELLSVMSSLAKLQFVWCVLPSSVKAALVKAINRISSHLRDAQLKTLLADLSAIEFNIGDLPESLLARLDYHEDSDEHQEQEEEQQEQLNFASSTVD